MRLGLLVQPELLVLLVLLVLVRLVLLVLGQLVLLDLLELLVQADQLVYKDRLEQLVFRGLLVLVEQRGRPDLGLLVQLELLDRLVLLVLVV